MLLVEAGNGDYGMPAKPHLPEFFGDFLLLDELDLIDTVGDLGAADGTGFADKVWTAAQQLGSRTSLFDLFPDIVSSAALTSPLSASNGAAPGAPGNENGFDWSVSDLFAWDFAAADAPFGDAPSPGAAPSGGQITLLDAAFAAKGGTPGPGGGGGGGGGETTSYFSGSADGATGYDIWIEFKGSGWSEALQQAFKDAADYYTTVITDDIGGGGFYRGKLVDDLYVSAELKAIDGAGGILGQAGPKAVWTATELTAAGQMQFDSADAQVYFDLGLWDDIVTHELTHVLGFGSLWNYGDNPLVFGFPNGELGYTGELGLAAYKAVDPSATYIPVEGDGGSGTAGAHWDEETLGNELMTGYINNDGNPLTTNDNYLSKFSVMSLADLGYHVTYTPYDDWLIA